ncbi:hypothetical protein M758_8G098500 [Ceratodon purpureus]|nr:hypothetical protein M758_8G098500 [Ceratodon purpureus]
MMLFHPSRPSCVSQRWRVLDRSPLGLVLDGMQSIFWSLWVMAGMATSRGVANSLQGGSDCRCGSLCVLSGELRIAGRGCANAANCCELHTWATRTTLDYLYSAQVCLIASSFYFSSRIKGRTSEVPSRDIREWVCWLGAVLIYGP